MKLVEPEVALIARPEINWDGLWSYLDSVGGTDWYNDRNDDGTAPDAEILVEAAGRICYRSWKPGLNPNVTKVRQNRAEYLRNILSSRHGSVLEHANYTFAFRHISRVVTHELVRHRVGTAVSQESLRYVRMDEFPMWVPDWAREDVVLMRKIEEELARQEEFQAWMTQHFDFHSTELSFQTKKARTSFMRRFAPGGVATDMIWTANVRALRHIITTRTGSAAEEEIRLVFSKVAKIMKDELPGLFDDVRSLDGLHWSVKWDNV